ncbi:unnamed protein product, partial [Meganyctiphanes norvegica]
KRRRIKNVNMDRRQFSRMNSKNDKKNIEIRVQIKRTLSSGNCTKVLEDLLKYILYQRNQIPVQYEILDREVTRKSDNDRQAQNDGETTCDKSDCKQSETQLEKDHAKDRHQRKTEVIKAKNERKRQRWLVKVQQFIDMFKKVMKLVSDEIENGDIASVKIALGNSVITAREIFTLLFPPGYSTGHNAADNKVNSKVALQLFRSLIVSEDLVKLVTRRSTLHKVWILLQKKKLPALSKNVEQQSVDSLNQNLIPLPDYKSSRIAQVVDIFLDHQPAPGTPMALTPAIGNVCHSVFNSVKRSRKNLDFRERTISENMGADEMEVETIPSWQSDEALNEILSKDEETNIDGEISFNNTSKFAFMTPKPLIQLGRSINFTPRTPWLGGSQGIVGVDETPTVSSVCRKPIVQPRKSVNITPRTPWLGRLQGSVPVDETPTVSSVCSPAKRLASDFMQFNLIDEDVYSSSSDNNKYVWYQIPFSMKGFKDVLIRT